MKKSILYILAALAITTSCQNDLDVEIATTYGQSLTVALPTDGATTKVEYIDGESGVDLSWKKGDTFALYTADGDYVADFIYASVATNGCAKFVSTSSQVTLSDGDTYKAIFPAIEGTTTIEEYNTAFAERLVNQTQTYNNDLQHLNDAQRMEAEFTYKTLDDTNLIFEHKMASVRISFRCPAGSTPSKVVFKDDDKRYALNTVDFVVTGYSTIFTSYLVIEPNLDGETRDLTFEVHNSDSSMPTSSFVSSTSAIYNAGIQYRLSLDISQLHANISISTKEELIAFQELVNKGNVYIDAVLTADIDLEGEEWTPIGSETNKYSGTFEGGDHTISNFTINSTEVFGYQGLFGYITDSSILNVIVENAQIQGGGYTGAICGNANKSTISACGVVGGFVDGDDHSHIGGVVGDASDSSIINCYNTGSVEGNYGIGGVVGDASVSSITDCYNVGSVAGDHGVGGVVGYTDSASSVIDCYNASSVEGDDSVGGVVGSARSSIFACYNTGSVNGNDSIGGVVGYTDSSSDTDHSSITDCYNTGSVEGNNVVGGVVGSARFSITTCHNTGTVEGGDGVGGVVGSSYSPITDCYNTCLVKGSDHVGGVVGSVYSTSTSSTSVTSCYNTGPVEGDDSVGGVVGNAYSRTKATSITSCYNTGSIEGSGDYAGGVVGYADSYVTACYNTSSVSGCERVGGVAGYAYFYSVIACYNIGSIEGSKGVGGVAGYVSTTTITTCYNTGAVKGSDRFAGVVGDGDYYSSSTITNCYYLTYRNLTYTNSKGQGGFYLDSTLKSYNFPATLNKAVEDVYFERDVNNYNNGYPILSAIDYTTNQ